MHAALLTITLALALTLGLSSCSREPTNPLHGVNERLLASTSELSDEISKAISDHVEALHGLNACEKHATSAALQCREFKVSLGRAVARLCGLKTQRAILHKIMENNGDARTVNLRLGESCETG